MLPDAPVQQGDVFRWLDHSDDPWLQYGVIVTADCDIQHDKHSGMFTYVPILGQKAYLAAFFFPKRLERQVDLLASRVIKAANLLRESYASGITTTPFSLEGMAHWLRISGPASVCEGLGVPAGKDREEFESLAEEWLAAARALETQQFEGQVEALLDIRAKQQPRDRASARLEEEVSAFIFSLPGDGLYLSCIGPTLADGYVAYVRRPRELHESHLALKQSDTKANGVMTQRISRLDSPYRYRLTQQLAQVFGDVGLPSAYEEARSANTTGLVGA